ncbi:hypothetical protein VW23_008255 [Devosia insulae DS-56]|uniref:DUF308 domain-containing protein n=1 Tax=Devosia insulae DS-56 TaxID=1116389 RepID=A0A1E5XWZ5_9HYPH|nr:DUF308 domain-containing protein [Devosia insulae]OEO33102.1 hypothetical protein VW23_008255 [Devosia insulae DS-56]
MNAIDPTPANWLKTYAFIRFGFSAVWVAAALLLAPLSPATAAALLVLYPAWDAAANFVDAQRNGGLSRNLSHLVNVVVSAITTIAVIVALSHGMAAVVVVFGVWAILSGVLQLVTAVRRWASGGQWAMVLSGAQSALAGGFFVFSAGTMPNPGIALIAGYAAFGAVYFLVTAVWLSLRGGRKVSAN